MRRGKVKTGVIYLLTHPRLAARLVVSLYSLRKYYDGDITVFTTRPMSHTIGDLCSKAPELRTRHIKAIERAGKGYSSSYITKTGILKDSPYKNSIFLDADTLVVNPISELLDSAIDSPLTATMFSDFITTKDPTKRIIEQWRSLAGSPDDVFDLKRMIDLTQEVPFPAINTGVFAIKRKSKLINKWDQLTLLGRHMQTPEETALQLLLPQAKHRLLSFQFNCHPYVSVDHSHVRIWHFAGRVHLNSPAGARLWKPAYLECREKQVAQIASWSRVTSEDTAPNEDDVGLTSS